MSHPCSYDDNEDNGDDINYDNQNNDDNVDNCDENDYDNQNNNDDAN